MKAESLKKVMEKNSGVVLAMPGDVLRIEASFPDPDNNEPFYYVSNENKHYPPREWCAPASEIRIL